MEGDLERPTRWEVVRSLTTAQITTTRTLEDFAGQLDREGVSDDEIREQLERAIDSHERVIENLEFALAALEADEEPFSTEPQDREVDVELCISDD